MLIIAGLRRSSRVTEASSRQPDPALCWQELGHRPEVNITGLTERITALRTALEAENGFNPCWIETKPIRFNSASDRAN